MVVLFGVEETIGIRRRSQIVLPGESDESIVPFESRRHYNSWTREGALLCSSNLKMEGQEIAMRLVTPEKIRTLQRKLYSKVKASPAYRFYSLYDKVYRRDILHHAYRLVRANGGSPGIDGRTFEDIEGKEGVVEFLSELEEVLKKRTYQPKPVLRVKVPKANGGMRPLGIPTIRDRVAQMAVKLVIEPVFEAGFSERSYGFRPKRGAHDAIEEVRQTMLRGNRQVLEVDLYQYFEMIPHDKLMKVVAERIVDKALLHILKLWLEVEIVERDETGKKRVVGSGKRSRRGTPQGGVISPLLSNLYLNLLDRVWDRKRIDIDQGARLVRYADDFVILCRGYTARSQELVEKILRRLGLTINVQKTRLVNSYRKSFRFLGFEIRMRQGRMSGKWYPYTSPSKEALSKVKRQITRITKRERMMIPMNGIVEELNALLRGWVNYYHVHNCRNALLKLRYHVEERCRIHLRKRHKLRDYGSAFKHFPANRLYKEYKIFKVPTTAGWTKANALS